MLDRLAVMKIVAGPVNGKVVRDRCLNHCKTATESAAYFGGDVTKGDHDSTKCALTIDSGRRVGVGTFKASEYFA